MGNSLISPVTEDKWKCSSDSAYWDDIIRLQSLKPECRWNNGRFRPVADVGELSATACQFSHRWMNWLALMLQWVTCLLSMHIFIYVWGNREWDSEKYWDYQKVRSCQMRWMQDFSFGAQITHKHAQRWRDGSLKAPVFHLPCAHVLRCEWTCMHLQKTDVSLCVHMPTHTKSSCTVRSQSAYILLGCAPISRINEEVSHFTVTQHAGLWGTNGYSLQFLRSVFNNVIDF